MNRRKGTYKWILGGLVAALLLPSAVSAETRVYVTFSVGSAIAVGGGLIFWGVSYSTRVSRNLESPTVSDPSSGPSAASFQAPDRSNGFLMEPPDTIPRNPRDAGLPGLPLFVYRW